MFQHTYPIHGADVGVLPSAARIGAPARWTGRGVTIAFIDSGFYPHPDFSRRVRVHVNASARTAVESRRYRLDRPQSWHGMMSAAIAAGDGRRSGGHYAGIAPKAGLALIAVTDARGRIKEADILRGLQWVLDHGARFGVRVVNLSVGGDVPSADPDHPIYAAIRELTERGVVVVAASGNRGQGLLVPPASAPEAITAGGVDDHNSANAADWTLYHHNWGAACDGSSKPDVLAPAEWVASPYLPRSAVAREAARLNALFAADPADETQLLRTTRLARRDLGLGMKDVRAWNPALAGALQARIALRKLINADYQYVDGTSVAAALVSGVAALMLEANPQLTPRAVKAALMTTAQPLPGIPAGRQGAGVIRPALALDEALQRTHRDLP